MTGEYESSWGENLKVVWTDLSLFTLGSFSVMKEVHGASTPMSKVETLAQVSSWLRRFVQFMA